MTVINEAVFLKSVKIRGKDNFAARENQTKSGNFFHGLQKSVFSKLSQGI